MFSTHMYGSSHAHLDLTYHYKIEELPKYIQQHRVEYNVAEIHMLAAIRSWLNLVSADWKVLFWRSMPTMHCIHVCHTLEMFHIPYSRKIFGSLAVYYYNRQTKICQYILLAYIHMVILYRTAKFKSANILAITILGSTAKFNSRQYFWLYGILYFVCFPCIM